MRVLGIDPGVATTGYAVVERGRGGLRPLDFGALRTAAGTPLGERLLELQTGLRGIIERWRPEVAAVERLFFNNNVRTAMTVGQASGVALLAAASGGLDVVHYTPSEVKASVGGMGAAPKRQVQAMVAALLGLDGVPEPADAADACALAICHLNRVGLSRAIQAATR